jgi:thiol-disulfide isomerase/thioredoxin
MGGVALVVLLASWRPPPAPSPSPDAAPALALEALDGRTVRLSDLRGSVVLVDIWASWCGPCKSSFPALDGLYRDLHPEGLEVLAVNVDERRRDAEEFLLHRPHEMTVLLDPKGQAPEAFGASAMPSSFLIDRHGVVRYRHSGYTRETLEAVRREISVLLEEPPEPRVEAPGGD